MYPIPKVTCAGVVVAEVIVRPVDAWPQPGRLSLVDHIDLHGGGERSFLYLMGADGRLVAQDVPDELLAPCLPHFMETAPVRNPRSTDRGG